MIRLHINDEERQLLTGALAREYVRVDAELKKGSRSVAEHEERRVENPHLKRISRLLVYLRTAEPMEDGL